MPSARSLPAVAPGVIPTLGLFAAGGFTIAGFGELFDSVSTLAWMIAVVAGAVVWTALAPRLTGARTLALCLGLFTLVYRRAGQRGCSTTLHPTGVDEFGNTLRDRPSGRVGYARRGTVRIVHERSCSAWSSHNLLAFTAARSPQSPRS